MPRNATINLGCTTIGNIVPTEYSSLPWVQGSWVAVGYASSDLNRSVISFVCTAIGSCDIFVSLEFLWYCDYFGI